MRATLSLALAAMLLGSAVQAYAQSGTPTTAAPGKATGTQGAFTTGGTAQVMFSGAVPARGWKIAIPSSAPGSQYCWASDQVTAPGPTVAGSYPVPYGGQYATEPQQIPAGPVYLTCPVTGQAWSAQRW